MNKLITLIFSYLIMQRKVGYIYSPEIEQVNFGHDHPMKPKKVAMTHDIIE